MQNLVNCTRKYHAIVCKFKRSLFATETNKLSVTYQTDDWMLTTLSIRRPKINTSNLNDNSPQYLCVFYFGIHYFEATSIPSDFQSVQHTSRTHSKNKKFLHLLCSTISCSSSKQPEKTASTTQTSARFKDRESSSDHNIVPSKVTP